jgi:hypothetical protein
MTSWHNRRLLIAGLLAMGCATFGQAAESAPKDSWTEFAQKADLTGDSKPDLLVEDLETFIPGEPVHVRMKILNPALGSSFTLKTTLNGVSAENAFTAKGDEWVATLADTKPQWIHYSVCVKGSTMCSPLLVVASPTTTVAYAVGKAQFVPDRFVVPPPPTIGEYTWKILSPEVLQPDFRALATTVGRTSPSKITFDEDYGEMKRHRWEFRNRTSFAYAILEPDGTEVACTYIQPSKKQGYDAVVRFLMTEQGVNEKLPPLLQAKMREWLKTEWPFAKVVLLGVDVSMADYNALPNAGE